ncbi:FliM/FliN family flagellar motor C-terminal domain-containing protein [Sphingomonas sp. VNH70]|uniref:FliM/FliN family flagellar motor switch protein n=1 Tax=Sphingomonas silueang TaxID=3156617 RepID=UPI0032B32189
MDARRWLPADTVPPPALDAALAEPVARWAKRWFAERPPLLRPMARASAGAMTWRSRDGLMLGVATGGLVQLGAALLGVAADRSDDAERDLLERLGEACVDDLRAMLAQAFGPSGDWRPQPGEPVLTAAIGTLPLAIGLSADRFAALVHRILPPPPALPLGSIGAALAAQRVTVGAFAGRVQLHVADLAALAEGDVVLLGGKITDAMPIAIDGCAAARGRVTVVAADPAPFLKITQPLSA